MSSPDPEELLRNARTIAVLGAHTAPERPAHYVPAYLASMGYRILPVNPRLAGTSMFGETAVATLAELRDPIDILDVFRPATALEGHLDEMLALHPRCVWLQLGIRHDDVAAKLEAAGIVVVQDRCTLADHKHFGLGRVPA